MKDTVNFKKADTDDARAIRDWLIGKINDYEKGGAFPITCPDIHLAFGSFARKTKIGPLDDIDLMFELSAESTTHTIYSDHIRLNSAGVESLQL